MTQKIIGICGRKGAGKDTIADIICELDPSFEKIAFADMVKDLVSVLFGWDRQMLQGSTPESRKWREEKDEFWSNELGREITPRIAMQLMGTDLMRDHLHKDIWIICLKRKIMDKKDKNFVITDLRFPNEINTIREIKGKIVRVERGDRPDWWDIASTYNTDGIESITGSELDKLKQVHPSERDWIDVDDPERIFLNCSTIEDLKKSVKTWLNTTKWS